ERPAWDLSGPRGTGRRRPAAIKGAGVGGATGQRRQTPYQRIEPAATKFSAQTVIHRYTGFAGVQPPRPSPISFSTMNTAKPSSPIVASRAASRPAPAAIRRDGHASKISAASSDAAISAPQPAAI